MVGEFGELRLVGRVGEAAGAQAVADGERDVVLAHDLADVVPDARTSGSRDRGEHPLGEQRPAAADDADQAVLDERDVPLADARVDRHVVDALLGLVLDGLEDVCSSRSSIFLPMIIE
jgi:hypothetical protein